MNPTEEALVPSYKRQRNQAPLIIRKQLKRLLLAFIMSEGEQSPKQASCTGELPVHRQTCQKPLLVAYPPFPWAEPAEAADRFVRVEGNSKATCEC